MRFPGISFFLLAGLAICSMARAQSLTQAPPTCHPRLEAAFSGAGVASSEAVNVGLAWKDALPAKPVGRSAGSPANPATTQAGNDSIAAFMRLSRDMAKASCMVYVGAGRAEVYAVYSRGNQAWTYRAGAEVKGLPAVADGIVYIVSADHKLTALNLTDGALIWTASTEDGMDISPVVARGLVLVGSASGRLQAFSAHTGAFQWRTNLGGAFGDRSQAAADSVDQPSLAELILHR